MQTRLVIGLCQGLGKVGGGCVYKRARRGILVVIELFHISIVVVDTQSHTFERNCLELNTHMHPYSYTKKYE